LVRHDLDIENLGRMADLKVDGSPIRLGAQGRYREVHFGLIGRIQLRYERGIWNEWHILFDDGRSGWLGEAQGTYAITFLTPAAAELPRFNELTIGRKVDLKSGVFRVANIESSTCISGEGELPFKVGAG